MLMQFLINNETKYSLNMHIKNLIYPKRESMNTPGNIKIKFWFWLQSDIILGKVALHNLGLGKSKYGLSVCVP